MTAAQIHDPANNVAADEVATAAPTAAAPVAVTAYTATTAVGAGRAAVLAALRARRGALKPHDFLPYEGAPLLPTWIGEVAGVDSTTLPAEQARFDCRNNRLAWLALQQDGFLATAQSALARYGAERVAVVIGTSTSGLLQAEAAFRRCDERGNLPADFDYAGTLNNFSAPAFIAAAIGARGPAYAISTACSSSAKVFPAAARLLRAGLVDAAIVGGVDSLCLTTLCGFGSLELLSPEPCRPFDRQRRGISIGEGAGFALLERARQSDALLLLGAGESSDAHHMSTPHPDGLGAELAMRDALRTAALVPKDIDYINLHGTATRTNDAAESRAVERLFGRGVPTSSTKSWFGHLLGAAGIAEAVVSLLVVEHGHLPGTLNTTDVDPECGNWVLTESQERDCQIVLSNSFGFGGSNCSLIFGRSA